MAAFWRHSAVWSALAIPADAAAILRCDISIDMLRALMASASGCITLSLALHATLLWGASGHESPAERHVAVDLVPNAIALGFEDAREPPGANDTNERTGGARAGVEAPPAENISAARPRAGQLPVSEPRVERSSERRAAPKPHIKKAIEQPEAVAPAEPAAVSASPPPVVAPSPVAAASPALPAPKEGELASTSTASLAPPTLFSSALPGSPATGGNASSLARAGGAAGASGAASAGPGADVGSTRDPGADAASRAVLREYARRVRSRIAEQREYPYAARRARLHGTVCLRIELAATGRLLDVAPTCGGSLAPLARAALAAVAKAAPFPPLPAGLGQHLTLDVPVIFELED
jgi:periplasmic protein TonB